MRILLEAALSNAVVASLLALVVVAICRFPIRPAARHALWLIVLVKFVTPPLFRLELPSNQWLAAWTPDRTVDAAAVAIQDIEQNRGVVEDQSDLQKPNALPDSMAALDVDMLLAGPGDDALLAGATPPSLPDTTASATVDASRSIDSAAPAVEAAKDALDRPAISLAANSAEQSKSAINIPAVLGTVWIGGSIAWFLFAGMRLRAFHRQVVRLLPAEDELQRLADDVAVELGLKKPPLLRVTDAIVPPMLTLIPNRAVIILPARLMNTLSRSQQSAILAHELAHFRRGDQWMRWFEFLVVGLYWWHPAVWYARKQLQAAEELCCDAWVLRVYPDQARGYAHALLAAVDFLAEVRAPAPAEACTLGPISSLKQRLDMILKRKPFPELTPAAKLALAALAFIILPWAPQLFGQAPVETPPGGTAPVTAPVALPPPSAAPAAQSLPEPKPPATVPAPPRAGGLAAPGQELPTADPAPRVPTAGNNPVATPPVAPVPAVAPRFAPGPGTVTWPIPATYGLPSQPGAPPAGPQGKSIEDRLDRLERMIEQFVARAPTLYGNPNSPVATPVGIPTAPHVLPEKRFTLRSDSSLAAATDRRIRELEQELATLKRRKEAYSNADSNGTSVVVDSNEKAIRAVNMSTGTSLWSFSIDNPESVQSATSNGQVVTVTTKDGSTFRLDSKTGRMILGAVPTAPAPTGSSPYRPLTPSSQGPQQN